MRLRLLLAGAILILSACHSSEVPQTVQSAFLKKYPGVLPDWEPQAYGYEAVFIDKGIEYEAEFSQDGQWLETEYEVLETQFPLIVLEQIRQKYPDYVITKREIELTPQGTFYEVEVERGDEEIELYFDERANPASNSNEDA
ncbi:PepSY-like domain-containing protein [Nostoc sp. UHCC 0702]|nr:PepSY-like domain-containing protein [Nostoc sp. UHCC 0702]